MALRPASSALLLLACGAAAAQGRQQVPTFSSEVELITVDAVVLDGAGRPVPGLTKEDFAISEDGRPQQIVSFEAFALEAAEPDEAPVIASNAPRVGATGRAFGILLDDLALAQPLADAARKAAAAFVERTVRDGDEVVLGTSSGDLFWSARIPEGREDLAAVISRVQGRGFDPTGVDAITEYEAFRIANYEDAPAFTAGDSLQAMVRAATGGSSAVVGLPTSGIDSVAKRVKKRWEEARLCLGPACDHLVRTRSQDIDAQRKGRMRALFAAMRRELDALSLIRGRKALLLFSSGFVQDTGPELRELTAASREANTAVYFLDARGLMAQTGPGAADDPRQLPEQSDQSASRFEQVSLAAAGSETLADETGGFSLRNSNDLEAGARRIASESRIFYLLGFQPPDGKSGSQWRKLRVAVTRPGFTVRARRGYTLRPAALAASRSGKGPDPAVARALDSAHEATGIPLRAMTYVFEPRAGGKTHVVVAAEFDAARVALSSKGTKRVGRVEVSVVALLRDSGQGYRHQESLEFALEGAQAPGWRAFVREFELPPGVGQARVVVRDPASGALGSAWQRFEVPAPSALRLSTPIVTDRLEPNAASGARPQPALAVHRLFRPEGQLYCEFQVFGAERAGDPRVAAGLELTHNGRVVRSADPTPIAPDRDGRLVRLVGLGLAGMEEGDYELRLTVRDELSRARLERVEPFTLARVLD